MDTAISTLISKMIMGGPGGVIAVLIFVIFLLLYDRKNLLDKSNQKDKRTDKIVDEYYRSIITLSESLNSVESAFSALLQEMKDKL